MANRARLISCLLLSAMLIGGTVSCAESKADVNTAVTLDETTVAAETEDPYKPDLPETDFDGANFRMASRDDSMHSYPLHTRDLYAEEITGDLMNDAVYERNQRITNAYNVNFVLYAENEVTSETTTITSVEKSVAAGTDDYDLLLAHMIYGAATVMKGYYLNWNSLPYVDTSMPYWCQGAVDGYRVGDRLLLCLSDMCVSSNDCTHCMLFNKELAQQYNVEDIYSLVYNNKWIFEKFRELTRDVTTDLDGDGKFNANDRFGYGLGGNSGQLNYLWAGGSQVTSHDAEGIPYLDMLSERTVAIYDFLYELRFSNDAYLINTDWSKTDCSDFFAEDKALFMHTQIGMINNLRNMESDFGIIPYPKYDEAQANYGHYVDGHATLMAVPITVQNRDMVGIVIEALSYDSYKNLLPIYYDTITVTKFTRDEESAAMLDIIYNSRVFDFAYVYDDWKLAFAFSNMIDAKNENFTSFYQKNEKAEISRLNKVISVYEGLES